MSTDSCRGNQKLYSSPTCPVNDSMNPLGARKDRHAKIGEGFLGLSAMGSIINHPALKDLPFCLETPNELSGYAGEIALLKTLRREPVSAEGPE